MITENPSRVPAPSSSNLMVSDRLFVGERAPILERQRKKDQNFLFISTSYKDWNT